MMGQLFENLLNNALKYSREEEPPRIRVSATRQGNLLIVFVQDNGNWLR